jgi:hypothetical protein
MHTGQELKAALTGISAPPTHFDQLFLMSQ